MPVSPTEPPRMTMRGSRVILTGFLYFAAVFGVGFVLGPVRVLWLEPRVGVRAAELIEAPVMLATIVLAARWIWHRAWPAATSARLMGVGLVAAGLVLLADLAVGVGLRKMSVLQVFSDRDAVAGTVYYALIGILALMPWLHSRLAKRRAARGL
jgi:hypothetical protein